jgi:putative phosphoesterase
MRYDEIMRIGLISDTHIPWERKALPPEIAEIFRGVDLILHAGDIYSHSVLDELGRIAPVLAALGDDDYVAQDPRIKETHILGFEDITLWLTHERPYTLRPSPHSPLLKEPISSEGNLSRKPDIIIFGHEHRPVVERVEGVLYVNSGSPTFLNYRRGPGTVALLELKSGLVQASIINL